MLKQAGAKMSTEDAFARFDGLEAAPIEMMIGAWRGEGVDTGHPMDGMLEATRWLGKVFEDTENVYPLVHRGPFGGRCFVNPAWLPVSVAATLPMREPFIKALFPVLLPLISTKKAKARLRTVDYRGKRSAAMVYDDKPIIDIFRKIDDDHVFAVMDMKGMDQPFFFRLTRETS